MNYFKYIFLLILILFILPSSSFANKRVAVLNFSTNISRSQRDQFQTELVKYLNQKEIDTFDVSSKFLKRVIKQFYKQKLASKDNLIKIGHETNAKFLIWGDIEKTKAAIYTVTVKVLDVQNKSFIYSKKVESDSFKESVSHAPAFSVDIAERIFYSEKNKYPHNITVSAAYFHANDNFQTIKDGYGYGVNYTYKFLNYNINAGIDTQLFFVDGDGKYVEDARMVPVTLFTGYDFVFRRVTISPHIHFGTVYTHLNRYTNELKTEFYTAKGWNTLTKFNMRCNIALIGRVALSAGFETAFVKKKDSFKSYQTYYIGLQTGLW